MVDNTFSYGDVVQVTGTSTQLAPQRLVRRLEHPPGPLAPRKHHLLTVTPVKEVGRAVAVVPMSFLRPARGAWRPHVGRPVVADKASNSLMEGDSADDRHGDDRGSDEVDGHAERGPPPRVGNEVAAVLP